MKKRSIITTTLGSIVIIGAVVSVFVGKADWISAGAAITIGTGFIFSKDHDAH